MALTGSISRNSITPSGSSFQVDLNVEAQATIPTGSIIGYDFIRNGIIENTVTIPPTNNYSNIPSSTIPLQPTTAMPLQPASTIYSSQQNINIQPSYNNFNNNIPLYNNNQQQWQGTGILQQQQQLHQQQYNPFQ